MMFGELEDARNFCLNEGHLFMFIDFFVVNIIISQVVLYFKAKVYEHYGCDIVFDKL